MEVSKVIGLPPVIVHDWDVPVHNNPPAIGIHGNGCARNHLNLHFLKHQMAMGEQKRKEQRPGGRSVGLSPTSDQESWGAPP